LRCFEKDEIVYKDEDTLSEKYATLLLSLISFILIIFRAIGRPLLKLDFEFFIFYLPTIISLTSLIVRSRKK